MGANGIVTGLEDVDEKLGRICYYGYIVCWRV